MDCIICGKHAITVFCEEHFLERNNLFSISGFDIGFCKMCGFYYIGKWKGDEDKLKELIKDKIKGECISKKDVLIRVVGSNLFANVTCSGFIKPARSQKIETRDVLIKLHKKLCDSCVKHSGGYYEAKIQIRGEQAEKILGEIQMKVNNEPCKNGYDLKFIFKADALRIAKRLEKTYDVIRTRKLVTFKKGQPLYRYFYLIK